MFCCCLCFLSLFLRRTLLSARVVRQRTCIAKSNWNGSAKRGSDQGNCGKPWISGCAQFHARSQALLLSAAAFRLYGPFRRTRVLREHAGKDESQFWRSVHLQGRHINVLSDEPHCGLFLCADLEAEFNDGRLSDGQCSGKSESFPWTGWFGDFPFF